MPQSDQAAIDPHDASDGQQQWGRWRASPGVQRPHSLGQGTPGAFGPRTWAPRNRTDTGPHAAMIQELYARQNKGGTPTLFTGSDFQNYGYWADGTQTLDVACDNLVQLLLSFLPEPPKRIVDVGCGKGAATARLRHHLPDADITGIDFSESQLSQARSKHPDLRFEHMDAGHMGLGEGSLDALISMDTMHQIMTREAFLEEAKRLLAPGGTLVFSDLLLASEAPVQPPANFIEDAQSYAALGLKAGFDRVEVFDTTEQSWAVFSEYQLFTAGQRADRGEIRPEEVWLTRTWMQQNAPKACVVGWMRKA